MRLSELLGLEVGTESGSRLGRVFDVRGELTRGRLRVTGLVLGGEGMLERLGLRTRLARAGTRNVVRWADVVRVDRRRIVVRDVRRG